MELFDTLKSAVQRLLGRKEQNKLHRVTDEERKNAIIKERPDLCVSLNSEPTPQTVRRDNSRDISFLGWQVANVEERSPIDNRRICYLKLFFMIRPKRAHQTILRCHAIMRLSQLLERGFVVSKNRIHVNFWVGFF